VNHIFYFTLQRNKECSLIRENCGHVHNRDENAAVIAITAFPSVMRYKNPTPNPLPASDEGAMMYLITKESAVSRCYK